jgi:NitT/TauT family transport system substrate-binding protein
VYVFSEPVTLQLDQVATRLFPVADSGFNPYAVVVATHGDMTRQNPKLVLAMKQMLGKAWASYLAQTKETNQMLSKLNTAMSFEAMELASKYAEPFIRGEQKTLGNMDEKRWKVLQEQLTALEVISEQKAGFAQACFWQEK